MRPWMPKMVAFGLAAVVLIVGVWWAIAMPQHFDMPGEGRPMPVDDTATRLALATLSVVVAAALVILGIEIGKRRGNSSER